MKPKLTYDLLKQLYLDENKSSGQIAKELGYGKTWIVKTLRRYGLTNLKSSSDREKAKLHNMKETNLAIYGSVSPFGNEEIKKKCAKTFIENYGVDHPTRSKEIRKKIQDTCKDKYGSITPFGNEEIKNKANLTNLNIYGHISCFGNEEIQEKVKETLKTRYNTHVAAQCHLSDKTKELLNDKEKMKNYLKSFEKKPTLYQLVNTLQITHSAINKKIREMGLEDLINYFPVETRGETEIKEILNAWGINTYKDRQVLDGLEIDLYCPDYNIGIEYNGNHWHTIDSKGKNYHQNKSHLGNDKGVFIYHVFQYEWDNKREQIENQLRNLFNKNEYKIMARKCRVREITSASISREFLNNNHLQGADQSSIKLGLYYNEDLVAIMTFGKPRFNKKYEWELLRFCSKANYTVMGGASRLFKYFIKTYNPSNILTYSNIAHTRGKLYETLGFNYLTISNPNYVWIKGENYLSRYECQRYKLVKQFPEFEGWSETQIMTHLGYQKLEDCGNKVWIWNNPNK